MKQFIIIDEPEFPFSLDDFLTNNSDLSDEDKDEVAKLEVDKTISFGGGAAAEMILKRVA